MVKTIPQLEADVLDFWKKNKIFRKSVEKNAADESYIFYDGPPFVSGLPHYGHLLGSIAKDVIPRYWTMRGKRVERSWGWDAHGLTVENKVQARLGIKNRRDIENFGLEKFTQECYKYTSEISAEWGWYIDRIGRWVDMDTAYKTTDRNYMESVIWAFKQLYDKGLIYEGVRTSLYCTTCGTPVSNFEIAMDNSYKDYEDPAITVEFKIVSGGEFEGAYVLAWTTTPWTIPSNRALVVDPNETYVIFESAEPGNKYICAEKRLGFVLGESKYKVLKKFKGNKLLNLQYEPPYKFFGYTDKEFRIYDFEGMVNMEEGTGIVHSAPGFGDIDTQMGRKYGLRLMMSVDDAGCFVQGDNGENPFYQLFYVKANPIITQDLKSKNMLFDNKSIVHRVPYHDRCDTVLIQKAQNSWFIDVDQLKNDLLQNNESINWVPSHLKEGRFKIGIEQAPDWCISRNRFWATPMPVWESKDGSRIVVGSVTELEKLAGKKVKDLHRPYIDGLTFTKDGKEYKRRPEVLDSWMEAGSMPYAQIHYPFENKDEFEKNFPGDYIVEYVGQVRAWFYVMHILSTALFGTASFRNVISTGVIAGSDGRKMSKTYANYTDPKEVLANYGGDALRLYFMGSPLMLGENTNFDEAELKNKLQRTLNPLWNSYKFFETYATSNKWTNESVVGGSDKLDVWILSRLNETVETISKSLENYTIPLAVRELEAFVDDLSRWYIRRSRDRISVGDTGALKVLYDVLLHFSNAAAPLVPFLSESIYLGLRQFDPGLKEESVHLRSFTNFTYTTAPSKTVLRDMAVIRTICSLGLSLRNQHALPVRQPLSAVKISGVEHVGMSEYEDLIKNELNIKELIWVLDVGVGEGWVTAQDGGVVVALNTCVTAELQSERNARELIRQIQDLRKGKGLTVSQKVKVLYPATAENIKMLEKYGDNIKQKVNASEIVADPSINEVKLI